MKKLIFATILFSLFLIAPKAQAATYYIDCTSGDNAQAGTSTGTAWLDFDQYGETARSAGDIAVVRRDGINCDNGTDLTILSDGTLTNPITMESDYDNAWGDFASSSQTYTITRGQKEMTASATITGIASGSWIYVTGEDQRVWSYEVASVAGTALKLYLPYKGGPIGAGLTLNVMGVAPKWNNNRANLSVTYNTDEYWKLQGIYWGSGDTVMSLQRMGYMEIKNTIIAGDGGNITGLLLVGKETVLGIYKTRFIDVSFGINTDTGSGTRANIMADDLYFKFVANNSVAFNIGSDTTVRARDIEADGLAGASSGVFKEVSIGTSDARGRNITTVNSTGFLAYANSITTNTGNIRIEDYQSVVGDNRQFSKFSTVKGDTPFLQSSFSTLRSGGGATSIEVNPNTNVGTTWGVMNMKIFEYPIYLDTTKTTFDVYLRASATADWSVDPTASELWIEIDVLASVSGAFRYTKKSTNTISFTGGTTWQNLTLSATASQSGMAYLKLFYAKTKEAGSNEFYVDIAPVFTQ